MRWLALVAGIALTILAFAAVTRVADTREGLISEVVTLFAGLGGIALLIYGLAARKDVPPAPALSRRAEPAERRRSGRDLWLGVGGLALAALLLSGLSVSGGLLWAAFGLALLLPMIAGCVYLCVRFLRSSP